jgi:hypothetical protein
MQADGQAKEFLSSHVLPAMLRAGNPARRDGAVRLVLRACIRLMAEARGLVDPALGTSLNDGAAIAPGQLQAALDEVRFPPLQDAPDLDLPWEALAGCLPTLGEIDWAGVDVRLPGAFYTAVMDDRGPSGSYYTPAPLASEVARQTIMPLFEWTRIEVDAREGKMYLAPTGQPPIRILDPAVGGGHFLIAAGDALAEHLLSEGWTDDPTKAREFALSCFYGIDRDPVAAEIAACALWLWAGLPGTSPAMLTGRIVCGDTLMDDDLWKRLPGAFDAVIGNPPFASVFSPTKNGYRDRLKARYRTARGSFDLSVPFVERALSLCREGGRCGLVLPNKILAAAYAAPLRKWIGSRAVVEAVIDYSGERPFEASVYPVACVFRRERPTKDDPLRIFTGNGSGRAALIREAGQADLSGAPGGVWSGALDPEWETLRGCLEQTRPLGEIAAVRGGMTVGEAYELREFVGEASVSDEASCFRLATTGLIGRHRSAWGEKPARFLKADYQRPALPADCLPSRRCEQAASAKLVVAGLGRVPRAFVDAGRYQASVSTFIVLDSAWPLHALCAVLNSRLMARLYRALFGGLALAGGYLRFGKRELSVLPIPDAYPNDPRLLALDRLARRRAEANGNGPALDGEIDRLVDRLYEIESHSLTRDSP